MTAPVPAVDFHCHLDLYPDPQLAVRRCENSSAYVLSVTTTPKAWRGTVALANGHERIRTALGLHPQLAHERIGELALFDSFLPQARYIGEVGLDGSPQFKRHWREQVQVFNHILASVSREGGRIISIHSRRATTAVLDMLALHRGAGIPILHWFSGTQAELKRANELGCWYSVGPAMLFGKRGRDLVSAMPRNRVLTETDGPFATAFDRSLEPAEVGLAYAALGECWDVGAAEAATIVLESFRQLATSTPECPR